jgi:hypothetical protein
MPELGAEARKAVDRHLESVADHLVAVMWECSFAIVRAAEERAPDARPAGVDGLVERLQSEAERITDDLTALRARSASPPASAPPAPSIAVTWTPADGLAPEPFDDEPEPKDEEPEEPEDVEPGDEDEPESEEPDPSGSGRRRASMHDSPVWSLFHRTESRERQAEREPEPEPKAKPKPKRKPKPAGPGEPPASSGGNERLIELARRVEKRAGGAPPAGSSDPA